MKQYSNAYGLHPLNKFTPEQSEGSGLTMPGMSVDINKAKERYTVNLVDARIKSYYDQEGLPMPDISRMDNLEKLQMIADQRDKVTKLKEEANKKEASLKTKHEASNFAKAVAAKAEQIKGTQKTDVK